MAHPMVLPVLNEEPLYQKHHPLVNSEGKSAQERKIGTQYALWPTMKKHAVELGDYLFSH